MSRSFLQPPSSSVAEAGSSDVDQTTDENDRVDRDGANGAAVEAAFTSVDLQSDSGKPATAATDIGFKSMDLQTDHENVKNDRSIDMQPTQ